MALKLVPFDPAWVSTTGPSGAPLLDIHAIYRRPRKTPLGDPILDEAGFPEWDLTGGLPLQHHAKWVARGFEYVTLATREDLIAAAAPGLQEQGVTPLYEWASYVQHRFTRGPWDAAQYLADVRENREKHIEYLKTQIARFGADAAEAIERRVWPAYRLPASLRAATPEPEPADEAEGETAPPRRGRPPGRKPKPEPVSA